ncbi:hypothetical protein GQ44DRAFT_778948 [Phaeosphaeriaceae sp. PMI808]|nr:hypothetical protein GQ44DRAFT_778948 [Phaeosphaeriaceae sp. PMI808]
MLRTTEIDLGPVKIRPPALELICTNTVSLRELRIVVDRITRTSAINEALSSASDRLITLCLNRICYVQAPISDEILGPIRLSSFKMLRHLDIDSGFLFNKIIEPIIEGYLVFAPAPAEFFFDDEPLHELLPNQLRTLDIRRHSLYSIWRLELEAGRQNWEYQYSIRDLLDGIEENFDSCSARFLDEKYVRAF